LENLRKLTLLSVLGISITGCVPKYHTIKPEIEGKVIDKVTKNPLKGVMIGNIVTNKDGSFVLKGKQKLGIATPMGGIYRIGTLSFKVTHKNYQSMSCSCEGFSNQNGCLDVAIPMKHRNTIKQQKTTLYKTNFNCENIK